MDIWQSKTRVIWKIRDNMSQRSGAEGPSLASSLVSTTVVRFEPRREIHLLQVALLSPPFTIYHLSFTIYGTCKEIEWFHPEQSFILIFSPCT